ncbi:hypothetical protein SEEE2558_02814 [Salmonella enterica subsp. enterica serovar Enteritidis str. 22558]|nr:hypothetical protein SEEE2558_02814 [Salmonella enterica subsp. enterica serovar Enteritidis str. 22558]
MFFVDKFHNAKCSSKYIDQKLTWQRQRSFLKRLKSSGYVFYADIVNCNTL